MRIINPIYDGTFKYLMQNEKLAKKLIGIILNQEVLSLEYSSQEISFKEEKRDFPVFRMDFNAVIIGENGEEQNVLIELQKSNNPDPVIRFRKYLSSAYSRTFEKKNETGEKTISAKPIITIYILGYNMPGFDYPAIMVDNQPYDILTKEPIERNDFIKLLTHKSYILQIGRVNPRPNTRLEKLLSLFDQSKKTENDYILNINQDLYTDLSDISQFLHYASEDETLLKQLETEYQLEIHLNNLELKAEKAEQEKLKAEEEKLLEKENRIKAEQEKAKAEQEKFNLAIESAKEFKSLGVKIEQIIKITGLSKEEIEKL